ncbi:cel3e secreted beta-glucosidase [Colletotrichum incanum]|uniref:beta-glucosidase n=1 Tax=Colletotrichum incanum TaxID=1573173 RepID=A0A167AS78_COLIC|nr:cel3e secreted beta-glucosidase [Colletotrichum incanum]
MCSHNRINNIYGCENSKLLNGILKTELGYDGFVLFDWNAHHNLQIANDEWRIFAVWYLVGQDLGFLTPGVGTENLTTPHEQVDARDPKSRWTIIDGEIAGHFMVVTRQWPTRKIPTGISSLDIVLPMRWVMLYWEPKDILIRQGKEEQLSAGDGLQQMESSLPGQTR